ncbi:MAG: hypothetical protein ACYDBB_06410 [Armatimonadota bacterium]
MGHVRVDDELLRDLIDEVGPHIEQLTGWNLALTEMRSRAIAREQSYEEIVLARLRGAGCAIDENAPKDLIDRVVEYIVEGSVIGAYEPSSRQLLVIRENAGELNFDGLKVVVGHELVHRGQHVNHPELFTQVDAVIRKVFAFLADGGKMREAFDMLDDVQRVMTLFESHAFYVQQTLAQSYYPTARITKHFNLPNLLIRIFGGKKIAQYTDALPEVEAAAATGSVDALYEECRQAEDDVQPGLDLGG